MSYQIQVRRDSESNWNSNNPVLAAGEIAFSTDQNKIKIGDGTTAWASLSYLAATGTGNVATDAIWDAKGDLAGGTGSNTAQRLAVGTNDQVLTADSTQTTGMKWATPKTIANDATWAAKGDLIVATANDTAQVLTVGTNNQALVADSTQTTGVKWAAVVNSVAGTANEVTVSGSTGSVTIGLPDSITVVDLNTEQVDWDTTPTSTTMAQARVLWDSTYSTLNLGLNANVACKIGQGLYKLCHNNSGVSIAKGDVVYVSGSTGTTLLNIAKARADAEATSATTVGIAAESISSGSDGFVQVFGFLEGLTTNTIANSPVAGDALYLSEATAGAVRGGLPTAPNHGVRVGFLIKVAGGSGGSIFVNVQNYQELEELSDVTITSKTTNDFLVYDTNKWVNKTPTNARTAMGLGSVATENVVPANKGGTGETTLTDAFEAMTPSTTAGDLIYYNGTNHVRLGIGTADQVLTVNTGATAPEWKTATGGGGVSDGDKGDITVSSSGATWTIDNDVVTFAKMQNIATDRLLGRDTASSGDVEELTVGGGIEFTGTGIQTSAFTGDVTKSAGGTTTTIANDAVTFAKMQNIATDRLLGRDTASSGDIEELTVGGGIEFTGTGIQTSAFTGDVTKTAGGTTTTIANDAVTYAKFQEMPTETLLGNPTAGTANPTAVGLGQGLSMDSVTSTLSSELTLIDTELFTSSQTYNIPAGAKVIYGQVVSAGGGGGAGGTSTVSQGISGAGGGGGNWREFTIPAAVLGSSVTVTIGAGGTGSTSNVRAGTGGMSRFAHLYFSGAQGGVLGAATGQGVNSVDPYVGAHSTTLLDSFSGIGGNGRSSINNPGFAGRKGVRTGGGGGGGGGITVSAIAYAGGAGGTSEDDIANALTFPNTWLTGGGGTGTTNANGGNGAAGLTTDYLRGGEGGGGGSSANATAYTGGNGGIPGGGGGGGGAQWAGTSHAAGGNGGDARIKIWVYG